MATEGHFHGGGEPAQIKTIWTPGQKRRLGEVHLTRHMLHPLRLAWRWQDTHGGRVAGEGGICKGVNLDNA
jgi:hypothetical protein